MTLDYDCIRSILVALEDLLQFEENLKTRTINLGQLSSSDQMKDYSKESIVYCTQKLIEAGFIKASILKAGNGIHDILYGAITFNGHQYLDSIRNNAVWEKTKSTLFEKGLSLTFDLILNIAPKIALNMLNI